MESTNPYSNLPGHGIKFHEGWLEHKNNNGQWIRYWCVLKGNVFYFFSSDRTACLTHVGTLSLDHNSKFDYKAGDAKSGFKFDLHTPRRISHFKALKSCEREIWRACVEGISKGQIPDSIDLLPGQIRDVQDLLEQYHTSAVSKPPNSHTPLRKQDSLDSNPSLHSVSSTNSFDSPNASDSGSFPPGPPQDYYLTPLSPGPVFFTGEQARENPSWFFQDCTRQLAEQILRVGSSYGNTLMRSRPDNDKDLVISKMVEEASGAVQYSHFIVKCHSNGYKIDVENPHEPMGSLAEVMQFFVETSNRLTTRPMRCNNLGLLGLAPTHTNPYNTSIVQVSRNNSSGQNRKDEPFNFPPPPPPLSPSDLVPLTSPPMTPPPAHLTASNFVAPPPVQATAPRYPAPPPTQTVASHLSNTPPAHVTVPNFPAPPPHCRPPTPHKPAPPPPPPQPHTKVIRHQVVQSQGQQILRADKQQQNQPRLDRSKSEPAIAKEILEQVQKVREEQLKKFDRKQHMAKKMPGKSQSLDHEEKPPPLPPNHPTAGKGELNAVTRAINKRLSAPQIDGATESFDRAEPKTKTSTLPAQPSKTITNGIATKTGALSNTHSDKTENSFLDELAKVTAKVAKQPLVVKKAPEVAPKPSTVARLGATRLVNNGDTQTAPSASASGTNRASDSFKKKLGEMIVGTNTPSTSSSPGVLNQTPRPGTTSPENTDLYENLEQYQNAKEILASTKFK